MKLLLIVLAVIGALVLINSVFRFPMFSIYLPGLYVSVSCGTLLIPAVIIALMYRARKRH